MRLLGFALVGIGLGLFHPGLAFMYMGLIMIIANDDKEPNDANTPK